MSASTLNFRTKITKYISDSYFVMFQTTFIYQNFIRRQTLPLDPSQSLDHVQLLLSFQFLIMKLEQDILLTFQGSFQNGLLFSDPTTWMYGFLWFLPLFWQDRFFGWFHNNMQHFIISLSLFKNAMKLLIKLLLCKVTQIYRKFASNYKKITLSRDV